MKKRIEYKELTSEQKRIIKNRVRPWMHKIWCELSEYEKDGKICTNGSYRVIAKLSPVGAVVGLLLSPLIVLLYLVSGVKDAFIDLKEDYKGVTKQRTLFAFKEIIPNDSLQDS